MQCSICGAPAQQKSGVSKSNGKPWRGIFCSADKNHVQWDKIGGGQPKFTVAASKQEPNWDEIRGQKREDIQRSMAFQEAVRVAIAVYNRQEVVKDDIGSLVELLYLKFQNIQGIVAEKEKIEEVPF